MLINSSTTKNLDNINKILYLYICEATNIITKSEDNKKHTIEYEKQLALQTNMALQQQQFIMQQQFFTVKQSKSETHSHHRKNRRNLGNKKEF